MKANVKGLIICVCALLSFSPLAATAQDTLDGVWAYGSGTVACYTYLEQDGFAYGEMYKVVDGEQDKFYRRKFKMKRDIRKTRKQIRRASRQGQDTTALEQFLSDLKEGKRGFRTCSRGDYASGGDGGGGSGDGGSGSGGGGDSGSGGGGNTSQPCAVVTGDLDVSTSRARIINGVKCTVDADTPTVELSIGCTGTVIGARAVLTAAHCTEGQSSMSITAGNGTFQASQVLTHPSYNSNALPAAKQDVALLLFDQDLGIPTVAVYKGTSFTAGESSVGGGYGYTQPAQQITDGLWGVIYNITSSDAEQVTTTYTPPQTAPNGSNCNGDSGGPLFVQRLVNGVLKWVVGGIVSNGTDNLCGSTGNQDEANFAITGNATNLSFIQQHVSDVTLTD